MLVDASDDAGRSAFRAAGDAGRIVGSTQRTIPEDVWPRP